MAWNADKASAFAQEIIGWQVVHIHKHAENKYSVRRWNTIDDWFPNNIIETLRYVENWCDKNDCNLSITYADGRWLVNINFQYVAIAKELTEALIAATLRAHDAMAQDRKVQP